MTVGDFNDCPDLCEVVKVRLPEYIEQNEVIIEMYLIRSDVPDVLMLVLRTDYNTYRVFLPVHTVLVAKETPV